MCLVIQGKIADIKGNLEVLENAYLYNQDGYGLMYASKGNITVKKGFKLDKLIFDVEAIPDNLTTDVFVHLRYRTHGAINHDNLHPFKLSKDVWLMHNGTIDIDIPKDTDWSDTKTFVELIKPAIVNNPKIIFDPQWQRSIAKIIESNRIVLFNSLGQSVIFNKKSGIEYNNLWCSNTYAWDLWESTDKHDSFDLNFENIDPDYTYSDLHNVPSEDIYNLITEDVEYLSATLSFNPSMFDSLSTMSIDRYTQYFDTQQYKSLTLKELRSLSPESIAELLEHDPDHFYDLLTRSLHKPLSV